MSKRPEPGDWKDPKRLMARGFNSGDVRGNWRSPDPKETMPKVLLLDITEDVTLTARWLDPYSALVSGFADFGDFKRCTVHVVETDRLTKETLWIANAIASQIEKELHEKEIQPLPPPASGSEETNRDNDPFGSDGGGEQDPGVPSLA